jgi:hypothetical protein
VKRALIALLAVGTMATAVWAQNDQDKDRFQFIPGTLVLSRSVYAGNQNTVVVGQTLPPGCQAGTITLPEVGSTKTTTVAVTCSTATANGTYPGVFNNDAADGSFGVTSPIFLDEITTDGFLLGVLPIPSNMIVTSFSSKSELALNRSDDGKSITFVGYVGGPGFVTGPNQLDVSNSNTPGVIDPTNPVVSQYYRSVAEVDTFGHIAITEGNAYSGNNGRAAIKAGWRYYLVGNDNNGGLSKSQLLDTQVGINLVTSTGSELLIPGQAPATPPNITMIGDFEITQVIDPATCVPGPCQNYSAPDKAGKDNNFRGLTIHKNTLYVTKGSGGNGINTVYQVGTPGVLPSGAESALKSVPITILPGFPTTPASGTDGGQPSPIAFPFGIWFANDDTLYVCDEGDGTLIAPVNGNVADAPTLATAGLQKWHFDGTTWHMLYVLQNGLNIGVPYSIPGYPTALNPATDGCRNLTGRHNFDGTVTLYAVTSTISASGDQGADPNKLVKVTDRIDATTLPTNSHGWDGKLGVFTTIRTAHFGEVLRGVTFAPTERDDDHRF